MLRNKKQPSSWTSLNARNCFLCLSLSLLHVGCVVSRSSRAVCTGWYNCKLLLQFAHLSDQLFKLVLHTFEVSFQSRLHSHLLKFNSVWKKIRDKQKLIELVSCIPGRKVWWWNDLIAGLIEWPSEVTDWLAGWLADWLTYWLTDWRTDWLTSWLTEWLTDGRTDWLNDCLPDCKQHHLDS